MADSPSRLLPAELAPDLLESHIVRHSASSQAIYCAVLLLVAAAVVAMPLTQVDIFVQADGIVRPAVDKHDVRAASAGTTDRLLVRENQRVARGDPILVLQRTAAAPRERPVATREAADRSRLVVRAPVSGTVEQVARLGSGSFVQVGDVVAVVSPDLPPIVEVYIAPRDVGLIRVGAAVRFQIDAFNYHDWGVATGRVTGISDDYVRVDDRPMFKVWCSLDPADLGLRSGVHGRIRKGMTVRARFPIARQSVLQLLRDDVSGWVDPKQRRS